MKKALVVTSNSITYEQKKMIETIIENARKKGEIGITDSFAAQRIINRGEELRDVIISKMKELSLELPEMECFGISDWQKFYGISFTPKRISTIGDFPWSNSILDGPCPFNPGKTIRETHFAFVGFEEISIIELQKLSPRETEPRFYMYAPDAWYSKEKFAIKGLKPCWHLLLKEIVPGSENKTFDEQKAMLPRGYEVPSAVAETAKDVSAYKKTGIYLNPSRYARAEDFYSQANRVVVGCCGVDGIYVRYRWSKDRRDDVGIGASRKLP